MAQGIDKNKLEKPKHNAAKEIRHDSAAIETSDKLKAAIFARKNALFPRAFELLSDLLKNNPNFIEAQKELAALYIATENFTECESYLLGLEKKSEDKKWILLALVEIYQNTNQIKKQTEFLKKYLDIQPDEAGLKKLFDLQKNSNDIKGALQTILTLRSMNDRIELEAAQAQLTALLGKHQDALVMCEALLEKTPIPKAAVELLIGLHLGFMNNPDAIIQKFEPKIKAGLNEPIVFVAMAKALHRMEHYVEAIEYLKKALAVEDFHADWWYDISLMYRQLGQLSESQECLMKSIRLNPLNPTAIRVYGVEHQYIQGEEAHQQLNYIHAHDHLMKGISKMELHMALAKAYEDFGELRTAFKYYENVSHFQAKISPYRHSASLNLLKMTRDRITKKTYENFSHPRCQSEKAVFVLGMPRSGTSLVEQVIASHPNAHGAGELKLLHKVLEGITINNRTLENKADQPNIIPTYIHGVDLSNCRAMSFEERGELYVKAIETLAELSGKKEVLRVVDKMPGNYFWTGIIPFILPKAKIIHTERHPLDNCLSLYRIFFPDGMPWSYNLKNLGKVYRSCYEHMRYWQANLTENTMISVNYEVMVNDFENQAKDIISHIGLPWNDSCLKFYETERQVKTASLNQVRKPIYDTSIGRWKKYEEFLKPLITELGPVIKEYEDLIATKLNKK
jgi:tetratricopeptide (TPR) repeat protein